MVDRSAPVTADRPRDFLFLRSDAWQSRQAEGAADKIAEHPVFDWMKGTATIPPGFDLTEPADSEWGARTADPGR
jgi:hypothetical protein